MSLQLSFGLKMFYGLLISILFAVSFVQCLKAVPERAEIHYYNEAFVKNPILNVRRYSRKGRYCVNAGITSLHTWGNNLTANGIAFEYLHNEYRRTFIDLRYRLCDFLNFEPYIGKLMSSKGSIACPVPPGTYFIPNITLDLDNFPYTWPFERIKAQGIAYYNQTILINASVYFRFLDIKKYPRRKQVANI